MNQINILFVDIDGTLTTTKSGKPFKQSPDDIKPLPGSQKAVTHFANRGYKIFGVSNQGGCDTIDKSTGKPFKSVDATVLEMQNTLVLFPEMTGIYFCPSMVGRDCVAVYPLNLVIKDICNGVDCRKPGIGMITEIIAIFNSFGVDNTQSLFVGDRDEDRQCAANSNIPFMDDGLWRVKYGSFV